MQKYMDDRCSLTVLATWRMFSSALCIGPDTGALLVPEGHCLISLEMNLRPLLLGLRIRERGREREHE